MDQEQSKDGTADGGTPPAVGLPVDNLRDAVKHLRRPFTPAAVKFKVQSRLGKKEEPAKGALIAPYIDARLVIERLNAVIPDRWTTSYESVGGGLMWCHLAVDGTVRSDVGEGTGKALVSDALKRAAVHYGIAVSIYAMPAIVLWANEAEPKGWLKRKRDGDLELTDKGRESLARGYAKWLEEHGTQAFGEPLDHGDTVDVPAPEPEVDPEVAAAQTQKMLDARKAA